MKKYKIKKEIYKGKIIHLRLEEHQLPGGRKGIFEVIHHRHAGAVIPFLDKKTILLLHQYRPAIGKYVLEIPAGLIDPGENALHCVRRELEEETGYKARHFKRMLSYYATIGCSNEKVTLYKATGLTPGKMAHEPKEIIKVVPTSLAQAKRLVKAGKIDDAKTLIALQSILGKTLI